MERVLVIEGMKCERCSGRVQKALAAVEGVQEVRMSLEEKTATVTAQDSVPAQVLTDAVTAAGYEVKEVR